MTEHFIGPSHKMPDTLKCPLCGHLLNGAAGLDTNDKPSPGDYTVCIECASPLAYRDDDVGRMRLVKQSEFAEMDPKNREALQRAMAIIRSMDRRQT